MKSILCYGDSNTWGCIPVKSPEACGAVSARKALAGSAAAGARGRLLGRRSGSQRADDRLGRPARATPQRPRAAAAHAADPPASRPRGDHARDERPEAAGLEAPRARSRRARGCWWTSSTPVAAGLKAARRRRSSSARRRSTRSTPSPTSSRERRRSRAGWRSGTRRLRRHAHARLDAGSVISSSEVDGIHLDEPEHERLGIAVAERVRPLLG